MKKINLYLLISAVGFVAAVMLIEGCATPQVTSIPVVTPTPVVSTSPVIMTTQLGTGGVVYTTNWVNVTNVVMTTNMVLYTNFVANSTVTSLASTAQSVAPIIQATVPAPYGSIVGYGLGLLGLIGTTIAGGVAASKNAQANLHQSTLQAVVTGIENALPGVQQALATPLPAGAAPASVQTSLTQSNAVLSAVKASITSTTVASGTATNLNTTLAKVGIGPTAA